MIAARSSARLLVCVTLVAVCFAGTASSAAAIGGSIVNTDPVHPFVLGVGTASSCMTPNAPTAGVQVVNVHYDVYGFVNTSATAQCVTVTYEASSDVFIAAYSPSFNPAVVTQNFLGSTAGTASCGGQAGSFSFTVPAGATFVVEVEECTAGAGVAGYAIAVTGTGVATTPVTLRSLTASATAGGVLVRWRVGSATGLVGFNVYREQNGRRKRLNGRAIPLHAAAAYAYLDRTPSHRAARYWLQLVRLDGSRTWYGPALVR